MSLRHRGGLTRWVCPIFMMMMMSCRRTSSAGWAACVYTRSTVRVAASLQSSPRGATGCSRLAEHARHLGAVAARSGSKALRAQRRHVMGGARVARCYLYCFERLRPGTCFAWRQQHCFKAYHIYIILCLAQQHVVCISIYITASSSRSPCHEKKK